MPRIALSCAVVASVGSSVLAQSVVHESEPNNTPAEATPVFGEAVLVGAMEEDDQDAYEWTVSDVDALKRWTFELQGVPGRLTIVDVFRVEYAENGVEVAARKRLFKMGTRDGTAPSIQEDLLFEPGEYILGVASSGGGGSYRPPVASVDFGSADGGTTAAADSELGGYRLTIRKGSKLYVAQSPQAPPTRDTAQRLRLGHESAGYFESPETWYEIEIGEKESEQKWDVVGQVPVGRSVTATLHAPDGSKLATAAVNDKGQFAFRDLGLERGSYTIEVAGKEAGFVRTLAANAVGRWIEGAEAEPNDSWELANRVDLANPVTGRMGRRGESDFFRFSLDDSTSDQVLNLRAESGPNQRITLDLVDGRGRTVQSRTGEGSAELSDLVLEPGVWGFVLKRGPKDAKYTVTLSAQGAIEPGVEAEPNDRVEFAVAVPANNRIKGRFTGRDTDFFKFLVTEEPQLWRFQVIGDGVQEIAYHDGAGIQSQDHNIPAGQRRGRLENLFLLPGTHHVRVSGIDGGSYTLLARAIGPPGPNAEREPNDDTTRMQPLALGQTRTGLLPNEQDRDYYRFYLGHSDRIRLTIEPPPDGAVKAHLYWDGSSLKELREPQVGQTVELDGLFLPGDYQLALSAKTPSDGEYKLSLERLERFGCGSDCEPNDNLDLANPLPASHVVEGRHSDWRDDDWYKLPLFDRPTEMTVTSKVRENIRVVTREYSAKSVLDWDGTANVWRGTVPEGVQTYLHVRGARGAAYRLDVEFPNGPEAQPAPPVLPVELVLQLETTEVSAYRRHGQQVSGEVRMTNSGTEPLGLELEAATSDTRWRVELDDHRAAIPAGDTVVVPITLRVPVDAWADRPVRVSVRARSDNASQQEAFVEVTARPDTLSANPVRWWSLPKGLLGGFNVASVALGGRWTGEEDSAVGRGLPELFDGVAVEGQGVALRGGTQVENIDVIVDLAGAEPVPVAGFALNLLSGRHAIAFLQNLDIALSLDGRDFTAVIADRLLPIRDEQAFALESPVMARFARLRLENAFEGSAKPPITVGEFKVLASPGFDISGGQGFNLAEPKLGGHVVWSRPVMSASGWSPGVLKEGDKARSLRFKGRQQDFVVGFHHDRAAQISRVEWLEQEGESSQFSKVALSASTDSSNGPWLPMGELDLTAAASPAVLNLDPPVWGRFVKFSATREAESGVIRAPAQVRLWERPTANEYRSILTEWGWANQEAIYEHLTPLLREQELEISANNARATAQLLPLGRRVRGEVELGQEEDWFAVVVPGDENLLTISLGGAPTVRAVVHVEAEDGEPVPVRKIAGVSTPGLHVFEAVVEPAGTYFIRVEEPPRNVVFIWDTSASVGAFLPVIYNSLIAYAEDLVPGRDAANLLPFGGSKPLLRDWYGESYIIQTVLNDYPRTESSSEAEATLARASELLAPRAGTKAIVMVTDAATNYYPKVWDEFEEVRPRVFGLGVSSAGALGRHPKREQDLMQDWSRVNGGHYTHLKSEGEMEIAFDRVATLLRRPAPYTLEVASAFREAPGPGTLKVVSGEVEAVAAGAVELILDASGSMLKRLEGKRRIEVAREVLTEVVTQQLPAGTPMALRVFGHKEAGSCRTDLEIPLGPLDPSAAARTIGSVNAKNYAKTPIADSLAQVASDLKGAQGKKIVVLVTDGEETCDGDAEKVIQQLQDQGIDVRLNIVGFAIGEGELAQQFEGWAELGGGRYFSAENQSDLSAALEKAITVPFTVYDTAGTKVAEGAVDGEPLELEQGFYRVVVDTAPPRIFERVEVPGEEAVVLEVGENR